MPSVRTSKLAGAVATFFLAAATTILLTTCSFAGSGTVTVSGTQWGITSQYLGANEGSSQFNINDLVDLGINTYRMYGGMSRWEPTDAESTYGSPTIAQIEADPNVINWAFYDNIFINPPAGSDYSWSASPGPWYHLAVSRSGDAWKLYVDGTQAASATVALSFPELGGTQPGTDSPVSRVCLSSGLVVHGR